MATKTRFVGYPSAVIYEESDGKKPIQHCIWGDWLYLKEGRKGDYREVHVRNKDGWMHKDDIQKDRLLTVIILDVGQAEGCLVITPDDKHMLIDTGEGYNMKNFLNWKYGRFKRPFKFDCAVISHPDKDHYGGLNRVLDIENLTFRRIYHNGIVERTGKDRLGPRTTSGRPRYLTDIIHSSNDLRQFLSDQSRWRGKQYPEMFNKAMDKGKCSDFRMLSIDDGYMPGYGPGKKLTVQVLGPVVERGPRNQRRLRWFGSVGKTKNGHSIVLRVQYRDVSLMLGGDLNIPSENFLLSHYTGLDAPAKSVEDHQTLVEAAREVFQVDIAKCCHHGSSDFSTTYLEATHPIATVISSGDNEPHFHPRADSLGSIGLYSRGTRPLIFSTELARSAKESVKHPYVLQEKLINLAGEIDEAPDKTAKDRKRKASLQNRFDKLVKSIERSVAVFGAINIRTDGHKVVIAQKLERPRSKAKKWDIYCLEPRGKGPLRYISKH